MRHLTDLIALNFVLLLALAQPVYSLGWKDKEWVNAGCPENISGQWIPRSVAAFGEATATVTKNQFVFHLENGGTKTIAFKKVKKSFTSTVLKIETANLPDKKILPYLKISPHLVNSNVEPNMNSLNQTECLIKVFRYQTLKQIKPNRYVNWDIYQIKTQN